MKFAIILVFICVISSDALVCYLGVDTECMIGPNQKDCGAGEKCVCSKYQFTCSQGDQSCTLDEQIQQKSKWAYVVLSSTTCNAMKQAPMVYKNVQCCSKNKCNKPNRNIRCNSGSS